MNRFFVEKENITDSSAVLYGEDVKHISSVLRLRTGDEVMLCDGIGMDYHARITAISKAEVHFGILSSSPPRLRNRNAPLRCSKGCLRQASLKP